MGNAIRGELKSMWEIMWEEVPASMKSILGPNAFENCVAEQWSSVAARLEMQAAKAALLRSRDTNVEADGATKTDAEADAKAKASVTAADDNRTSDDRTDNDAEFPHRRDEQWANMFDVRKSSTQTRLTEPEANIKIAARIAAECLRQHVTCPPMLDNAEASWTDARGYRWPRITCACKGCVSALRGRIFREF